MKRLFTFLVVVFILTGAAVAGADDIAMQQKVSEQKAAQTQQAQIPSIESPSITAIKKPSLKKAAPLPQSGSLLPQLFQVALGLLFVLGLIIALAWLFRRFGQPQFAVKGNFRVIGGVHLSTREKVVLLQLGKQQLLLGVAPGRVNMLHVLEEPLDLNTATPVSESAFAKRLSSLLQGKPQ